MSNILEEAAQETLKPGGICTVRLLRQRVAADPNPTVSASDLDELLTSDLHASVIARYLQKRGLDIRDQAVRRHKRRECRCP